MDNTPDNNSTVWNYLSTAGTLNNNSITLTGSTTDTGFLWFPVKSDKDWLPYHIESYKPEWHILLGYENQIQLMWDC